MRSLIILIAGVFSIFYIDLKPVFRTRRHNESSITIELEDQKEKRKQKRKKYKNKKFKEKTFFRKKHKNHLKGTHAKDHRYSNHKKLRRMYRNV